MMFWVYWVKYNILLKVISPVAYYAFSVAAGKCKFASGIIFLQVRCDWDHHLNYQMIMAWIRVTLRKRKQEVLRDCSHMRVCASSIALCCGNSFGQWPWGCRHTLGVLLCTVMQRRRGVPEPFGFWIQFWFLAHTEVNTNLPCYE